MLHHILLLVVAFLIVVTRAQTTDCRNAQPAVLEPNLLQRCDQNLSCAYCSRNHWSFDFLCCEDGSGWVGAHAITPMIIYLYWQNAVWTILAFSLWEVLEVFALISFARLVRITAFEGETWGGSLVGDALIQGTVGLWLGILLTYIFDLPLLVSTVWHVRKYKKPGRRVGYIAVWAIQILSTIALTWSSPDDNVRYGLYINMAVHLFVFALLHPWILANNAADEMIWKHPTTGEIYPRNWRYGFFYTTAAIIMAIAVSNAGWHYLANDWFQVWVTEAVIATVLSVWAVVVAISRRDWYMLIVFISAYTLAVTMALIVIGDVYANTVITWISVGTLAAAVIALVVNASVLEPVAPYNVNYSRRVPQGTAPAEEPEDPLLQSTSNIQFHPLDRSTGVKLRYYSPQSAVTTTGTHFKI